MASSRGETADVASTLQPSVFCISASLHRCSKMILVLDEPTELSLRERKKQRTRQALVDAARRLFERQGYEATTVAQIAAAADVSTRTFFSYFASKEDVLHDNTTERLEVGVRVIASHAPDESPAQVLVRAFDEMLADSWTMGMVTGLTGQAVVSPVTSPKAALARSNTRLDRLAGALVGAYPGTLDRVTAYAMVGAAIAAVSAAVAASLTEGRSEDQALAAGRRACRLATVGFHEDAPNR